MMCPNKSASGNHLGRNDPHPPAIDNKDPSGVLRGGWRELRGHAAIDSARAMAIRRDNIADLIKRQEKLANMAAIIFAASVGVELKTGDSTDIAVMKAKEILASTEKTK